MKAWHMTRCEVATLPLGLVALGLVALTNTLERFGVLPLRGENKRC